MGVMCLIPCFVTQYLSFLSSFAIILMRKRDRAGLEVKKLFSCSTRLRTKFILLINVKMPTIVGILTFISMINTTSERLKARNFIALRYFSFYEQLKFHAQLSWAWKKFLNLGAWLLYFNFLPDVCDCQRSVALPYGTVGLPAVWYWCIFWSYSLFQRKFMNQQIWDSYPHCTHW